MAIKHHFVSRSCVSTSQSVEGFPRRPPQIVVRRGIELTGRSTVQNEKNIHVISQCTRRLHHKKSNHFCVHIFIYIQGIT